MGWERESWMGGWERWHLRGYGQAVQKKRIARYCELFTCGGCESDVSQSGKMSDNLFTPGEKRDYWPLL